MARLRKFLRSDRGHVAVMTALMTPVAITLAAFAVDTGSLYVEKREAQMLADLAAISAASRIEDPHGAAVAVMAANGVSALGEGDLVVVPGRYAADAGIAPQARFQASERPFNAVQVSYRTVGERYFAGAIIPPPVITVSAVAGMSAEAGYSIGSRLLELEDGLANTLLSGLTGGSISLSAMDYEALLDAEVRLPSFLDALAVETASVTAGNYSDTLDAQVRFTQVAKALSKADGIGGTAKSALGKLAMQANVANAARLRLSSLIGVGAEDGGPVDAAIGRVAAEVGVMELLMTSAIVAGKGKQIALGSALSAPGLLSVSADLAIGEPPQHGIWFMIGAGGEVVRTAQARLAVVAEIGGLLGVNIRIPLYLELAYGEAKLANVSCPAGPDDVRVAIEARPGVANVYLAEVDPSKIVDFANPAPRSPASLLKVPLLVTVTGQAQLEVANTAYKTLTFTADDIAGGKVRQVSTQEPLASLARSLLSSLKLHLNIPGLGIGVPGNLLDEVGRRLGLAAPALDDVLARLLKTLGVSIGQADIRVHGASCGRAVLVQ